MRNKAILGIVIAVVLGVGSLGLVMRGWGTTPIDIQAVPPSGTVIDLDDYWNFDAATYSEVFDCVNATTSAATGSVTLTVTGPFTVCAGVSPSNWYRTDFEKDTGVGVYWGPNADDDVGFYVSDWVSETQESHWVRYSMGWFEDDMANTPLDSNNPPSGGTTSVRTGISSGSDYPYIMSTRYHTVPDSTEYYNFTQGYDWATGWDSDFCSYAQESTGTWVLTQRWQGWRCYGPYCGNIVQLEHHETGGSWEVVERWYLMEGHGLVYITQWVDYQPNIYVLQCTITDPCTLDGDTDCDCDVDIMDVIRVLFKQGCAPPDACYDADCDFDSDSDIDSDDLAYVKARWGNHCT